MSKKTTRVVRVSLSDKVYKELLSEAERLGWPVSRYIGAYIELMTQEKGFRIRIGDREITY